MKPTEPTKQFDVEEQIFHCWNIVEDLRAFSELPPEYDYEKRQLILSGLIAVYEMNFNRLLDNYEELVHELWKLKRDLTDATTEKSKTDTTSNSEDTARSDNSILNQLSLDI